MSLSFRDRYMLNMWLGAKEINPVLDGAQGFVKIHEDGLPYVMYHGVWSNRETEFVNFSCLQRLVFDHINTAEIRDAFCIERDGKLLWDCTESYKYIVRQFITFRDEPIYIKMNKFNHTTLEKSVVLYPPHSDTAITKFMKYTIGLQRSNTL